MLPHYPDALSLELDDSIQLTGCSEGSDRLVDFYSRRADLDAPATPEPGGRVDLADSEATVTEQADLPAGSPAWWRDVHPWAARTGGDAQEKRATITIAVPKGARTWPEL